MSVPLYNAAVTDDAHNFMPEDGLRIGPGVYLPAAAMTFTFSRGGGPGGQNVNKVNTHATLTVPLDAVAAVIPCWAMPRLVSLGNRYVAADPDRLVIHASESRSQLANRRACELKLRRLLIEAMNRPKPRRATRPTRAARQRRLDAKKHRARLKTDRRRPES